ncbi:MAG TPA: hypothetical protein VN045_16520 [Microbacteriaceae bacterium]|jgi:hypothetical protein|nr:hypothetical protein [Microbacteriaceae bacterium]
MSALTIDRRALPIIDRTAITLGAKLIEWGQRRVRARAESAMIDAYRADYVERVRTTSAVVRQRLLP